MVHQGMDAARADCTPKWCFLHQRLATHWDEARIMPDHCKTHWDLLTASPRSRLQQNSSGRTYELGGKTDDNSSGRHSILLAWTLRRQHATSVRRRRTSIPPLATRDHQKDERQNY